MQTVLSSRLAAFAATVAIAIASTTPVAHASNAASLPDFSDLVEQVGPAVVSIEAIHDGHARKQATTDDDDQMPEIFKRFFGDPKFRMPNDDVGTAIGTGFLISSDGQILTNHHVVDGADRVIVHMADRREFTAKVVGSDPLSDVALLKIKATGLPFLKIAEAKSLKAGQWVVAIGSPFGLDHSVTAGIVSAVGRRSLDQSQQYVPFIQTDVPINKGNSGGPLLNTKGEVVGINSQIFSSSGGYEGVSFAIPIETAMNAVHQLQATGSVSRGQLGVRIQEVDRPMLKALGLDRSGGALVNDVEPGSAAAKAGIRVGDVITAFNGNTLDSASDLPPLVGSVAPGTRSTVTVMRDGKTMQVTVVLDRLSADATASLGGPNGAIPDSDMPRAAVGSSLGISVQDLTAGQRKTMAIPAGQGVLIRSVNSDDARQAGLQEGDVILKLGSRDVGNASDLASAVRGLKPGSSAMLLLRRGQTTRFVAVPVGKTR
ncbi:MAG: Do family serine endopeptidase [Lysobacteraceae bacterium]